MYYLEANSIFSIAGYRTSAPTTRFFKAVPISSNIRCNFVYCREWLHVPAPQNQASTSSNSPNVTLKGKGDLIFIVAINSTIRYAHDARSVVIVTPVALNITA